MECPSCQKRDLIVVQYYYSDGTRAFFLLGPEGTATLCGPKPAIWEKTEFICEKHGIVIRTLDKSMTITSDCGEVKDELEEVARI